MSTKLRRLLKEKAKWTDKSAKKHKHDFSEECIIQLVGDEHKHIGTMYYKVIKCSKCLSFKNAEYIDPSIQGYPLYKFRKNKFPLGFDDIEPMI